MRSRLALQLCSSVARGYAKAVPSNSGPSTAGMRSLSQQATEAVRKLVENAGLPPGGGIPYGMGEPVPSKSRVAVARFLQLFLPVSGVALISYAFVFPDSDPLVPARMPPQLQYLASQSIESQEQVTNWSGTHTVKPKRYFEPESEQEVEAFVKAASDADQRLRVVGSALSPNGLGLCSEGMLSMALLDRVVKVDQDKQQVTVQAGCRVQALADHLKPFGLTLANYASIREQQIGGFTQVGAHGTGARIPPVDEQVVSMRLVTPALGTVNLSRSDEPELFSLAKVGLGSLGVVTQLTLQCVPAHKLVENTFTTSVSEVKKNHAKWLRENQHLRYMWIPYTESVVVVMCNPLPSAPAAPGKKGAAKGAKAAERENTTAPPAPAGPSFTEAQRLEPFVKLYLSGKIEGAKEADVQGLSATQLRDLLLAANPLNKDWVVHVNRAEEEYWKRSSGQRVGWSDEILGFDCGGQQWVLETAFPVANSLDQVPASGSKDILYMEALLHEIKKAGIPAHSPIEQRWTSGSSSAMSPAAGPPDSVHCWVGVIMYLPDDPAKREQVTEAFRKYTRLVQDKLMPRFNATWHWAKLEPDNADLAQLRKRIDARFPSRLLAMYRNLLDPKDVLGNEWLDKVLPRKQ